MKGSDMKLNHDLIMKKYKNGESSYKIASDLGYQSASVRLFLKSRNLLRRTLGRDLEDQVVDYLKKKGHKVVHQKGDASFDALVDGKRIDIKYSSKGIEHKGKPQLSYVFDIKHKDSFYTDYHRDIDEFYLVFKDEIGCPIYSLPTKDVFVKMTLRINNIKNTKNPLKLIGYLEKLTLPL